METSKFNIMFAGASGTGKTTFAKWIEEVHGKLFTGEQSEKQIPFLSGSVSDLVPDTKDMKHSEMLSRESKVLEMEDFLILNLRKRMFHQQIQDGKNFVCDRSFLDSAAYFLYKQSDKLPKCEVDYFIQLCRQLNSTYCSHLILFDFTPLMLEQWITEDNKKRITNNYFQMEISYIMKMVLDIWGMEDRREVQYIKESIFRRDTMLNEGATRGRIDTVYGNIEVLIVREANKELREKLIWQFLYGKI